MGDVDDLSLCVLRLKQSTGLLAKPAEEQIASFPNSVCIADELALDYAHWSDWMLCCGPPLNVPQRRAIQELGERLSEMGGPQNSHLWTDDALRRSLQWNEVRRIASHVLEAFGW